MQRSKQQALMFVLGAALVGGALGFSADRYMVHEKVVSQFGPRAQVLRRDRTDGDAARDAGFARVPAGVRGARGARAARFRAQGNSHALPRAAGLGVHERSNGQARRAQQGDAGATRG